MPITLSNVDSVFTYHAPDSDQQERLIRVREAARDLANQILLDVPTCADQQAALRHLREAVMTANAAIVLTGAI